MSVTTSTTITSAFYNETQDRVFSILGDWYGSGVSSYDVTQYSTIETEQWANLLNDVNRCLVHQRNTTTNLGSLEFPSSDVIIRAGLANLISTKSLDIVTDKNVHNFNQFEFNNTNATSTRTGTFGSSIAHRTVHTWGNSSSLVYWGRLGGLFSVRLSVAGNPGNSADDQRILNLINRFNQSNFGNPPNFNSKPSWFYDYEYYEALLDQSYNDTEGSFALNINITRLNLTQIQTTVEFYVNPSYTGSINVQVQSEVRCYYSADKSLADPLVPKGINAPRPVVSTELDFTTGGAVNPEPVLTKVLEKITTSLTIAADNQNLSLPVTVEFRNVGTGPVGIQNIIFSNPGVQATPTYVSGFLGFPFVLNSGNTFSFEVQYFGSVVGDYSGNIRIISDNETGDLTIPVTINIAQAVFNFTITPSSLTRTLTASTEFVQLFIINANASWSGYTATLSNDFNQAYSLNLNSSSGPRLSFNPALLSNGTYDTVLSVTVNGITRTADISMTVATSTSTHLGDWISAPDYENAIIGMSYDIISGVRYLTVGVGVDDINTPVLANGGYNFTSVSNLGINADPKYTEGYCVFSPLYGSPWSLFMQEYAVIIRPYEATNPINNYITIKYVFNVPTAGDYTWRFAVDNNGYFLIDGGIVGDLRSVGNGYSSFFEGVISLNEGDHTVTLNWINSGSPGSNNPGAIALAIRRTSDDLEIWSTIRAKRNNATPPYRYWQEVYRIPLTEGAFTYQSKNYIIKGYNASYNDNYESAPWGYYFGNGEKSYSLFTVTDDGFGNLSFSVNQAARLPINSNGAIKTVENLQYAQYYYSEASGTRYTQLETPPSTTTRYFLGFKSNGTVNTSQVDFTVSNIITDNPQFNPGYNTELP